MSIKSKLKKRLLEIPINQKGLREKHSLANNINEDLKKVEFYLNELVNLNILKEKKEYICPYCGSRDVMDDEILNELIDEDGYFECEECIGFIEANKNTTNYVYYDIKNKSLLEQW